MRTDILERQQEIENWIDLNKSKAFICKELRCKPITLDSYLKKMEFDYKGNQGSKGKKSPLKIDTLEYIKRGKNGGYITSHRLRIKLIEDGIRLNECEECGIDSWNNKKVSLQLHHIDGNRFNNELENLQILCPNCHTQTDNHSGKSINT